MVIFYMRDNSFFDNPTFSPYHIISVVVTEGRERNHLCDVCSCFIEPQVENAGLGFGFVCEKLWISEQQCVKMFCLYLKT